MTTPETAITSQTDLQTIDLDDGENDPGNDRDNPADWCLECPEQAPWAFGIK